MSDKNIIHIGENSPEQVAHNLMKEIALTEGYYSGQNFKRPSREWIIRTYAACLCAVRNCYTPDDAIELLP